MKAAMTLSRRDLLKAGGLLVGMALGNARAISPGPLPDHVPGPRPASAQVDSWLAIRRDNTAVLLTGRSEFGQGAILGLLQIAAEELDLAMHQISAAASETGRSPESGETVGSSSIELVGPLVRAAAAQARQALLAMAAQRLGAPQARLQVADGVVQVAGEPQRSVRYGELVDGRRLALRVDGKAPLKARSAYRIVGRSVPRLDVREKLTGAFTYVQHVRVPGMLHGRVVRPRGQGPYGQAPVLLSVDEASIADIPGARVVRRQNFLGVVAPREWDAVRAAAALKVQWREPDGLPGHERVHAAMRAGATEDSVVLENGDIDAAFRAAAHHVSGTFDTAYQAHAPFAPNCAVADVVKDGARVFCSTQGVYVTRMEVAKVIGMPIEKVVVQHVEGAGSFGPSCYHDAAQAAALMSQHVGRPVRVQFMRWDEFGWDNYGPGHSATVRACADAQGQMTGYGYDGWQQGWIGVEMTEELALGTPVPDPPSGIARMVNKVNAGSMYDMANRRLTNHHVWAKGRFLRGNPLRSPVDLGISFASEQVVDELARRTGRDPVAFRLANMRDTRWRGVLEAVSRAAQWAPRPGAQSRKEGASVLRGRGVAVGTHFVSYGAAVAEVEVTPATGEVRVTQLYGALDAGLIVNPRLVEQQIAGMLMQAASRALYEEVQFDRQRVTSLDWSSYPVLRMSEAPTVTAVLVDRPDQPSSGAGEEVMAAAAGAIANAVCDALGGVRLHHLPMTPQRVKAALQGAAA